MSEHHDHEGEAVTAHDGECDDAVRRLYEYLDGELDRLTVEMVEAHLRRCSPCLETFDFHAELRHVVRVKCTESMPVDLRERLLGLLDDAEQ